MDGWKMIHFLSGQKAYFQRRSVSFVAHIMTPFFSKQKIQLPEEVKALRPAHLTFRSIGLEPQKWKMETRDLY